MHHKIVPMIFALTLFLLMFTYIIPLGHAVEWSPDMRLTWDTDVDTFPSITQTSDGRIWVVWSSHRNGTSNSEIYFKVYNESQVHPWSPDIRLTDDPSSDLTPSIMQAQDGTIWIVWTSNRTGYKDIYHKTHNGTAWSSDEPLITSSSRDQNPSIMQAMNGTIWVVWTSDRTGDFEIYYQTSSDNGETWSEERLTYDPTQVDSDPSVMQTADGDVWVVWEKNVDNNVDIYYSVYNGTSWSPEDTVTTDPKYDRRPSIMQAKDGAIWVVWDSDRIPGVEGQEDIYYNVYNGSWSEDTRLTTDLSDDFAPSILQAIDDTIWVAWSSTRLGNMDIYYITDAIPDENDVAIFSVIPSQTIVAQGTNASIEVVAQNQGGTENKTFQISCYANLILIGSETIIVSPGQLHPKNFEWNTTSTLPGTYIIWAEASTVAGETDTADNTYVDGNVTIATHDVAVESVTPSHTIAHRGYTVVNIYVEVRNEGDFTESFQVTAYRNGTAIKTYTIANLAPKASLLLTFPWSTGVPYGNYTISARASKVLDEIDIDDNYLVDGTVLVTVPGDVNGDGVVDGLDLSRMDTAYGSSSGKPNWDMDCNINSDGIIDVFDLSLVGKNYGESST